jgi:hypothetical protein
MGMYDFTRENFFVNPDRYSEFYRHSQSWTDYLPADLRDQVWEHNPRTVEPRGGTITYDVVNTISGNWFLEGTTSYLEWSKQLVIGRHEIFADQVTILDASPLVDGDGILNENRQAYVWFIVGSAPSPELVKVSSGMVKYEVAPFWVVLNNHNPTPDGTVAIQLKDNQTIHYEWFEGIKANEVTGFTSAKKVYVR